MGAVVESREALHKLSPTQQKVEQAVAIAIQIAQPSRIFLFGSWARGDARWDSDLDMAILLPDSEKRGIRQLQRELLRQFDLIPMAIDLILATESYALTMTDPVNGIFHDIFTEGRLVYDARRTTEAADRGSAA